MSNIRIFFSESLSLNLSSSLAKPQSHYLTKVMRVKIGENFSLFNKTGEWLAKIDNIYDGKVEFSIKEQLRRKENSLDIWLAFSPIKSNYSNFMIQKATELGVTKFFPIIFDRTIVRKINSERLEKIIIEATEQSNRLNPPYLEKTQNLKTFLEKNQSTMDLIFTDLNSKNKKIEVNKRGKVRRARIFYFRNLTGKKSKNKRKQRLITYFLTIVNIVSLQQVNIFFLKFIKKLN